MATKKLKIKVGHSEQGDLFVESIQFCSQQMAESWGATFSASFSTQVYDDHVNVTPVVRMRAAGPIAEYYIDVTHSPFTGAAIVFDIPQAVTDALFEQHKQAKAYFASNPSAITREMQDSDEDESEELADNIVDHDFTEVTKDNSAAEFVDEDEEDYDEELDDDDEDDLEEDDSTEEEPEDIDDFSDDVYDEKFE